MHHCDLVYAKYINNQNIRNIVNDTNRWPYFIYTVDSRYLDLAYLE